MSVHPDGIAVFYTGFFQIPQDSALGKKFLEEGKASLRIKICITQHLFDLRAFDDEGICFLFGTDNGVWKIHNRGKDFIDVNFRLKVHRILRNFRELLFHIIEKFTDAGSGCAGNRKYRNSLWLKFFFQAVNGAAMTCGRLISSSL